MRVNAGPLIKVLAFAITMGLLIACIGVVFGRVRIGPSNEYHAVFSDASGLATGSDVRGNGVAIGTVKAIRLDDDGHANVTFTVDANVALTTSTSARIRYANLTGDRYLDLTPGARQSPALAAGGTIPLNQTQPALDLDAFFQGFDPLMRGLDPREMNELASNIIAVTQGEAGSVQRMLANVASFTNHMSDRDQLIGDTITHLAAALTVIDQHRGQVDHLIQGMATLMRGMSKDRKVIGSSLASVSTAADQTGDLLRRIRPGVKANIDQIGRLAGDLNDKTADISDVLDTYPEFGRKLSRIGAYGSFYNFYLCGVRVQINLPGNNFDVYSPWTIDNSGRCGGEAR